MRLLRDNVVIHEGTLKTLKRFKDEVREVRDGYECGMAFENYEDIHAGDVIECFEVEEVARAALRPGDGVPDGTIEVEPDSLAMTSRPAKEPTQRQLRVGEEIRHALRRPHPRGELHDPALSDVPLTVTEVRLSPDLKAATVFVMPLGGAGTQEMLALD